jgi:molybdopterin-guanine dinucleotide biosynthesis adapter protein
MADTIVLGFYGTSNTGKTGIIEKLVSWIKKEGYRVVAVKITDKEITMDIPGKDTFRYRKAGADFIVFSSKIETIFIDPNMISIKEIVKKVTNNPIDVIFIEGANDLETKKIRVDEKSKMRENTLWTHNGDINNIKNYILTQLNQRKKPMSNSIALKVNGKNIPLTEFPEEFIQNTLIGMVSTLKGVDTIETIEVCVKVHK